MCLNGNKSVLQGSQTYIGDILDICLGLWQHPHKFQACEYSLLYVAPHTPHTDHTNGQNAPFMHVPAQNRATTLMASKGVTLCLK